jgi:hypothetical protein
MGYTGLVDSALRIPSSARITLHSMNNRAARFNSEPIYQKVADGSLSAKEWKDAYFSKTKRLIHRMNQMTCVASLFTGAWLYYPAIYAGAVIGDCVEWKRNYKAYEKAARLWTANTEKTGLTTCKWEGDAPVKDVMARIIHLAKKHQRISHWVSVSSQGCQWIVVLVNGSCASLGKSKVYFRLRQLPDGVLEVTAVGVKRMLAPYEGSVGCQLDKESIGVIEDMLQGLQNTYKGKLEPAEMLGITKEQQKEYTQACCERLFKYQEELVGGMLVGSVITFLSFFVLAALFIGLIYLIIMLVGGMLKLP